MNITGNRLRELRKSSGRTLKEICADTNISVSGLASVERGENSCSFTTLKILADYYGVSTDYLLGNTDDKTAINPNSNIDVAFYDQHGIITDEQRKEIENFIAFIKSRDNK